MTVKEYDMELEVKKEIFYNEESLFGIYSCVPVHNNREIVNKYGNVSLQGTTRKLSVGDRYEVKFEGAYVHKKYGEYYKINHVKAEELNTIESQDSYLKALLPLKQFTALKEVYPAGLLFDMILNDQIDVSKTKGIKEKSLANIKKKVKENANISLLMVELHELGLSPNMLERILKHFINPDIALAAIKSNIFNLCKVKSLGFLTIDNIAQRRGDSPTNNNRIEACLDYILKTDGNDGHTWISQEDLTNRAEELLKIESQFIESVLDEMVMSSNLVKKDNRIAFPFAYRQEVTVLRELLRIRNSYVTDPDIEKYVDERVKQAESRTGLTLTDEQRFAVTDGAKHGVMILNGSAGSGKTASVKFLIESLGAQSVITVALSGKAVKVLSSRGLHSSTIHRMLGQIDDDYPYLPYDVIVIDEMSMVSATLFLQILSATRNGTKIIIAGDSAQLPSIGLCSGDILRDLLKTKLFPSYELTKVHRQAQKSGILEKAYEIRRGQQLFPYNYSGTETYGELKDQIVIAYSKEQKSQIPRDALAIAESYKKRVNSIEDLFDFQVLVSNRERGALSARSLNVAMQEVFNDVSKPYLTRNNYSFRENDKIIAQGNNYEVPVYSNVEGFLRQQEIGVVDVFNGTMGYIHTLFEEERVVLIKFEDVDELVAYDADDLDKIDMAYAITIHKSQGSGIRNVLICLDYSGYKLLSKQLAYTAITRASQKCIMLVEGNALHSAIQNDISSARRTFLSDLIFEEKNKSNSIQ